MLVTFFVIWLYLLCFCPRPAFAEQHGYHFLLERTALTSTEDCLDEQQNQSECHCLRRDTCLPYSETFFIDA